MMSLLVVLLAVTSSLAQDVDVQTQYGTVRGHTVPVDNGRETRDVVSFLGVPFAQDTSGANRFQRPVAPDPWADVFIADTVSNACPQNPPGLLFLTHANWTRFGEDCLTVNIATPDVTASNAVMVYMFGGGYQSGANFQYPGHFLATRDVVVVSVNYRLGVLGFAYTGDGAAAGNAGLWDQRMAIQFVVDNIAAFGGDPNRITVFGESAGAGSTGLHILSPQSKDLFQQAILQSGAETNFWVTNPPESFPENYTKQVGESLGCDSVDTQAMMECLRGETWENIIENGTYTCAEGFICMGISPVVDDPETGFLPDTPANLREVGNIMSGPVLAGINHDDASIFLPVFVPESLFGCCNRSYYELLLDRRVIDLLAPFVDEQTHEELYEAINFYYSPWPYVYNNYLNRESLVRMVTDVIFGVPWERLMRGQSSLADTYAYVYNYRSRNMTSLFPEWFGVPHIAEIPYVWGHSLLGFNPAVQDDVEINVEIIDYNQEDYDQTIFLQDLFANFAKTGDPTPSPVDNPLGGSTTWPRFFDGNAQALVISNTTIEAREFRQRDYQFWDRYLDYIMGPPAEVGDAPYSFFLSSLAEVSPLSFLEQYLAMAQSAPPGEAPGLTMVEMDLYD